MKHTNTQTHKLKFLKDLFYRSLSFSALILLLWSCQEELAGDVDPDRQAQLVQNQLQTNGIKDKLASKIAQNLAASLDNPLVLDFIKTKADEKFDGDFNFLIEATRDEALATSDADNNKRTTTFGAVVAGVDGSNKRSLEDANSMLDSLAAFYPLAQVFIPEFSSENFRTSGQDYLVAYIPISYDDVIPAYDKDGNLHELSSEVEPTVPVIVIKENERLTVIPKENNTSSRVLTCPILADAVFSNTSNNYYNTGDVYDSQNLCIGDSGGGSGSGSSCDRDSNTSKDKVYRMKFNDMAALRHANEWFDGGQELELTITFAQPNGAITNAKKFWAGSDSDFKDCGVFNCNTQWFYLGDSEVVTWNESTYGNAMSYIWIEKDSGNTTEISSSFTTTFKLPNGGSSSTTIGAKASSTDESEELAVWIVEYCDSTTGNGYEYGGSGAYIKWNVRQ